MPAVLHSGLLRQGCLQKSGVPRGAAKHIRSFWPDLFRINPPYAQPFKTRDLRAFATRFCASNLLITDPLQGQPVAVAQQRWIA